MKKSVLIEILSGIPKKEHLKIRKWLRSPIHNQREDVALLFDILVKRLKHPKAFDDTLSKASIFQSLFPKTEYDDASMRQVMHFLQKSLEQYLLYQAVSEDDLFVLRTLAHVFQKRNMVKAFNKTMHQAQKKLDRHPFRNRDFLRKEFQFFQEEYDYQSGQGRLKELNLQALSDGLDKHYVASKLRHACMMASHEKVFTTTYDKGLLPEALKYVEGHALLDQPAVALYYYSYRMLTEQENLSWFPLLKKQMARWETAFPKEEYREILLLALNYCIGKMNAGDHSFTAETLALYRKGLETQSLIIDGRISRYTFINIISSALYEQEYDWAEQVIIEYSPYIDEQFRETTVNLCYITLYFETRDYQRARALINRTHMDDILMNLFTKTILIKIYFEEDEYDVLESLMESMDIYLRRKEVLAYHRGKYKHFLRYLKKLIRLDSGWVDAKNKLIEEIQSQKGLVERDWLLKMLREKLI